MYGICIEITGIVIEPKIFGVIQDKWTVGGKCNVEHINGEIMTADVHKLSKSTPLQLVGWAMDIEKSRLPDSVIVHFEGSENTSFFASAKK